MPSCCRYCRLHLPPKDRGSRAQTVCEADRAQRSKAVGHPTPMMGSPRQSAGTVQAAATAHRSQTNCRRNDPGGRDPWAWCARCDRRMESVHVRENREVLAQVRRSGVTVVHPLRAPTQGFLDQCPPDAAIGLGHRPYALSRARFHVSILDRAYVLT